MYQRQRPPLLNPFDKFSSSQFDDWVGGLTANIRKAIRPPSPPLPSPQTNPPTLLSPDTYQDKLQTASDKGKCRAADEGPGVQALNSTSLSPWPHQDWPPLQSSIDDVSSQQDDTEQNQYPLPENPELHPLNSPWRVLSEDQDGDQFEDDDAEGEEVDITHEQFENDMSDEPMDDGHFETDPDGAILVDSDEAGDDPRDYQSGDESDGNGGSLPEEDNSQWFAQDVLDDEVYAHHGQLEGDQIVTSEGDILEEDGSEHIANSNLLSDLPSSAEWQIQEPDEEDLPDEHVNYDTFLPNRDSNPPEVADDRLDTSFDSQNDLMEDIQDIRTVPVDNTIQNALNAIDAYNTSSPSFHPSLLPGGSPAVLEDELADDDVIFEYHPIAQTSSTSEVQPTNHQELPQYDVSLPSHHLSAEDMADESALGQYNTELPSDQIVSPGRCSRSPTPEVEPAQDAEAPTLNLAVVPTVARPATEEKDLVDDPLSLFQSNPPVTELDRDGEILPIYRHTTPIEVLSRVEKPDTEPEAERAPLLEDDVLHIENTPPQPSPSASVEVEHEHDSSRLPSSQHITTPVTPMHQSAQPYEDAFYPDEDDPFSKMGNESASAPGEVINVDEDEDEITSDTSEPLSDQSIDAELLSKPVDPNQGDASNDHLSPLIQEPEETLAQSGVSASELTEEGLIREDEELLIPAIANIEEPPEEPHFGEPHSTPPLEGSHLGNIVDLNDTDEALDEISQKPIEKEDAVQLEPLTASSQAMCAVQPPSESSRRSPDSNNATSQDGTDITQSLSAWGSSFTRASPNLTTSFNQAVDLPDPASRVSITPQHPLMQLDETTSDLLADEELGIADTLFPSPALDSTQLRIPTPPPQPPVYRAYLYRHQHGIKRHSRTTSLSNSSVGDQNELRRRASPSATPTNNLPPRPSASIPTNPDAPVTRSNCRFHKISIPRPHEIAGEDEVEQDNKQDVLRPAPEKPFAYFIVPGCALGRLDVMKEEDIEDCGEATQLENETKVPDFSKIDPETLASLRHLVGAEMFHDYQCCYLPSTDELEYFKQRHSTAPLSSGSRSSVTSPNTTTSTRKRKARSSMTKLPSSHSRSPSKSFSAAEEGGDDTDDSVATSQSHSSTVKAKLRQTRRRTITDLTYKLSPQDEESEDDGVIADKTRKRRRRRTTRSMIEDRERMQVEEPPSLFKSSQAMDASLYLSSTSGIDVASEVQGSRRNKRLIDLEGTEVGEGSESPRKRTKHRPPHSSESDKGLVRIMSPKDATGATVEVLLDAPHISHKDEEEEPPEPVSTRSSQLKEKRPWGIFSRWSGQN